MDEKWLTDEEQEKLLRIARQAVKSAVGGGEPPSLADTDITPGLMLKLGAFVTLKLDGELRGCIGEMAFDKPLHQNVASAARASAVSDPRFYPLTQAELSRIHLEISVLSPLRAIAKPDDYDPQAHGIHLELNRRRAVFLPQVAREYGWSREETLSQLSLKAGLPYDAWLDQRTVLKVFTVQIITE